LKPAAYYRIKAVDKDGKIYLSNTIYLKANRKTPLYKLAANPAKENLVLDVFTTEPATIMLYNNMGQVVLKKELPVTTSRFFTLPVSHLQKGMYHLSMISGSQTQTEKVIIQ
jgi:hypothetical protein